MDTVLDPMQWDEQMVLDEVCTEDRPWHPTTLRMYKPNYALIHRIFGEQYVNGRLLFDLTEQNLKDDFELRSLRDRNYILSAVQILGKTSKGYLDLIHDREAFSRLRMSVAADGEHRFPTDRKVSMDLYEGISRAGSVQQEHPESHKRIVSNEPFTSIKRSKTSHDAIDHRTPETEGAYPESAEHVDAILVTDDIVDLPNASADQTESLQAHVDEDTPSLPRPKAIRRIQPELLTTTIDPDRERTVPTGADVLVLYGGPGHLLTPQNSPNVRAESSQPGSPSPSKQDSTGRRLAPELMTTRPFASDASTPSRSQFAAEKLPPLHTQALDKRSRVRPYCGRRKLRLDKIFYPDTKPGDIIKTPCDDDLYADFQSVGAFVPPGLRRYVSRTMMHFLRAQVTAFSRDGVEYRAVAPYNPRQVEFCYHPSFTLFQWQKRGKSLDVKAYRKSLPQWPELRPMVRSMIGNNESDLDVFNSDVLTKIGSSSWDPDSLKKWLHVDGGEDLLPVYGDSDSDNELDIETWREIEREQGTLNLTTSKRSGRRPISTELVQAAIDEAQREIILHWIKFKLPKLKMNDWKTWNNAQRNGTRRQQVEAAENHLDRIMDERLPKMRAEILKSAWSSQKQVRQQARIMEQSLCDREELRHKITVLNRRTAPERVPRMKEAAIQKAKSPSDGGHDIQHSESSDVDFVSCNEGVDDFIESDADITDGDAHMTTSNSDSSPSGSESEESTFTGSHQSSATHLPQHDESSQSPRDAIARRRLSYSTSTRRFSRLVSPEDSTTGSDMDQLSEPRHSHPLQSYSMKTEATSSSTALVPSSSEHSTSKSTRKVILRTTNTMDDPIVISDSSPDKAVGLRAPSRSRDGSVSVRSSPSKRNDKTSE